MFCYYCTCPIDAQLQTNANVVLHAADLAAQSDLHFSECVARLFELVAVHFKLFTQPADDRLGLPRHQVLNVNVNPPFPQHRIEQRHHSMLDLVTREHADAASFFVLES